MSERRERTCSSKRSFATRKAACKFGRRRDQRAYQCPYCHAWHLTTRVHNHGFPSHLKPLTEELGDE